MTSNEIMTEELTPATNPTEEPVSREPTIERSKGLTIKPSRLAGSDCCLNCGTTLYGPFCSYCGQPDKNFMRFFPVLERDLITDFLELDSRFFRTLKHMMAQH